MWLANNNDPKITQKITKYEKIRFEMDIVNII
jgi:hypothetical protein